MSKTEAGAVEFLRVVRYLAKWTPIAGLAGVMGGSASALLLVMLNWVTAVREAHVEIIALLPVAGLVVGCMYKYLGTGRGVGVEAGNNLILDEIHDPQRTIPVRMTPLVLIGDGVDAFVWRVGGAGRDGDPDGCVAGGSVGEAAGVEGTGSADFVDGGGECGIWVGVWDAAGGSGLRAGGADGGVDPL